MTRVTTAEAAVHPDATSTGKPHFEVLDGLRGTAAVMVVIFHIMGMPIAWSDKGQYLHHAAMAVDFFFLLSGFVVAYAYDARWDRLSVAQFCKRRLIRLHPLVVLGAVLGLISFLIDPFAPNQQLVPLSEVLRDFALACLLLPYAVLPNRWTDTHSLNSPASCSDVIVSGASRRSISAAGALRTRTGAMAACWIPPTVTVPSGSVSGYSRRPPLSPCAMLAR